MSSLSPVGSALSALESLHTFSALINSAGQFVIGLEPPTLDPSAELTQSSSQTISSNLQIASNPQTETFVIDTSVNSPPAKSSTSTGADAFGFDWDAITTEISNSSLDGFHSSFALWPRSPFDEHVKHQNTDAKLIADAPNPKSLESPQKNAPWHLLPFSQKKGAPESKNYAYPASAGEGVTIYIVDSGLNMDHPQVKEFTEYGGHIRWLHGSKTDPDRRTDVEGHGTCMWQYIASPKYGVAKRVTTVIVGTDKAIPEKGQSLAPMTSLLNGLARVRDELKQKPSGRAIVSVSHNLKFYDVGRSKADVLVKEIDALGALFVTSADNDGKDFDLKGEPKVPKDVAQHKCQWKKELKHMLLVGASDRHNKRSIVTSKDPGCDIDVFAPGEGMPCMQKDGPGLELQEEGDPHPGQVKGRDGTSVSTAETAAAAAVFWAENPKMNALEIRDLVIKKAQVFHEGVPIVYIGEDEDDACEPEVVKREAGHRRAHKAKGHKKSIACRPKNQPGAGKKEKHTAYKAGQGKHGKHSKHGKHGEHTTHTAGQQSHHRAAGHAKHT